LRAGHADRGVRLGSEGPKLIDRTVILDSKQIDTLLVIPL
jgi:hypothetical protein